jgi:hypothetical protein
MKVDTDSLYVACKVYDIETEIEPWEQYASFGKIEHEIVVSPKRRLVVCKNENGKDKYYDLKTGEELYLRDYDSSYESTSTRAQSLYLSDFPM